jgi:guanosine-3',5'-bis(diphosphate) 3'-pyrophosphohydrolase
MILKAAEFAAHEHRNQRRKGAAHRPYIGHLIEVSRLLADVGKVGDPVVLVAALLHDTLEDQETTRETLIQEFGVAVADVVAEVSDDKSLPSDERKRLQVEHAPHISMEAKLVKLADKISNVREIGVDPPEGWSVERRRKYFEWSKEVVGALGPVNPELERLFAAVLAQSTRVLEGSGS